MAKRAFVLRVGIVCSLAVAACSQSDPEPVSEDYYPLVPGASWTYFHSSRGGWDETVTVQNGEKPGEFLLTDTANPVGERSENTLKKRGTAMLRIGKLFYRNDALAYSVTYDPGFLRFDEKWLQEEPPFEEELAYLRTETDVGEAPAAPAERSHVYTVESLSETVEVEGRTFHNCVRIRRLSNWVPSLAAGGDLPASSLSPRDEEGKLFWFAPGVGKVREQNLDNGNTEVLVDYHIP